MPSRRHRLALALVLGLVAIAPPLRYLSILGFVRATSEAASMVRGETRVHHRLALRAIRPSADRRESARVEQGPVRSEVASPGESAQRLAPIGPTLDAIRSNFPPRPPLSLRLRC